MLVEINLLPQKEPRKLTTFIFLASLLFIMLVIGGYYFLQIHSVKLQIESADSQITVTKRIAEKENQQTANLESSNSTSQLKTAVDWANSYPIQTIPVMRHLTGLLPERGFIQSFTYTESGTVAISVQFDTAATAAYFLDSLNSSKWIEEASLTSLNSNGKADESGTVTDAKNQDNATGKTGTTTESNTQDNSSGTTSNTNPLPAGSQENNGSQFNNSVTGTETNPNNSATTSTSVTISGNGSKKSSGSTTKEMSSQYLPRYIGQFEIKFNKNTIKGLIKQLQKDKTAKEGGTGS